MTNNSEEAVPTTQAPAQSGIETVSSSQISIEASPLPRRRSRQDSEHPRHAHPPRPQRHCGRIDSDESPAMLVHDSPSLFEALPGQSGQPSHSH